MVIQQQVGRFEIREFLGRGAMGDVHLAWDPVRSAEVALKLIRLQRRTDPEMLEAEKNGIAIQRQISEAAPQVAAVYEQGQDAGFLWVAMEYVAGTDLSEVLSHGPLSETRAVLIARQLCAMLEVCHQFSAEVGDRRISGIVHGDIKPENIRLQENDRVRVLDFGIAKHLSQTRRFTVNLFGSLPYTPPERLDRGAVDRHSDLWAVGVVLYLMVSGRPPYTGEEPEELETKIRRGQPPEPLPADLSPTLRKIIQKSLAFDVARRYATAGAMKADLEAWLEGAPLPSESEAVPEPVADLGATRRTGAPLVPQTPPTRPAATPIGETRRTAEPGRPAGDRSDGSVGSDRSDRSDGSDRPATPAALPFRGEIGATRRTFEPGGPPPLPPPLPPTPGPPAAFSVEPAEPAAAAPGSAAPRRRRRWFPTLLILLGTMFLIAQARVHSEAKAIQHELVASQNPDLDAVWERYQSAARLSFGLGLGLGAVRDELRSALVQQAERILDSYHGDNPRTTEKGWQKAHHALQAALDLDFDRGLRARMIYSQAHLDRIASQTLRARGEKAEADKKIEDAVAGFRDAARRAPDWPDPYLGLARVYSYETFDLDALQKALGELGKRGYTLGRREKAMLADGFRRKGIELQARAGKTDRADDQLELLDRARDHFNQALSFYAEIPGYASSRANSADVEEHLEEVNSQLDQLHEPGVLEKLLGY